MTFFPKKLTCAWIKQAYKNNDLTPKDLIGEILNRCQNYTEKNIWIVTPSMELCQKYIDNLPEYNEETREKYPLWGVPFAIKDNIDLAGIPTTAACQEFAYTPEKSAFVVEKLIAAGAIPIGKTNLDQFATGLVGTRSPYGEVENAFEPELISGGSSSGSAVSVALGLAAFALGTDTAGSGRVPAMLNSLVGFKPSLGAWSTAGVVPACASLDCVTVFANNLKETQIVDDVAKGYDENCVWSRKIENNGKTKGKTAPKKIILPKDEPVFYGEFAEIYRTKWQNTLKRIEALEITVEYLDYEIFAKAAAILYDGAYVAERWADLKDFVESHPNATFPVTENILRSGSKEDYTASKLFSDIHQLQEYRHKAAEILEDAVMIMPTAGGTFTRDEVRKNPIASNSQMGLYTNHCNLLDLFAVALPENSLDTQKPFGITLFALHDAQHLALYVAEQFTAGESCEIAVCGIHKKGRAIEWQLTELEATFIKHTTTAQEYKLYSLNTTPVKPGLIRVLEGGECIEVDVFAIPKAKLGHFMMYVSSPLNIGDVKLVDGRFVKGFLCEPYAIEDATDITDKRSF